MVGPTKNLPQLRRLGATLRELRERAGLRLIDVVNASGVPRSTLSKLENGESLSDRISWARLTAAIGASKAEVNQIMTLVEGARNVPWLPSVPEQLATLVDYERDATSISMVSLALVPGLLQTQAYARAVLWEGVPSEERDPRLKVRMNRQAVLEKPVRILAILDEPVLHRPVGGREVMREQLRHLLAVSEWPNVEILVVPADDIGMAIHSSCFMVLEFARLEPVAYVDTPLGGLYPDRQQSIGLLELTTKLRLSAVNSADSAELIKRALKRRGSNSWSK